MTYLPILRTKNELAEWKKTANCNINFVPTMGGLHKGHQALIQKGISNTSRENSVVLVSIFVNPLQFGPNEDFKKYPRDLLKDSAIASDAGASAIWAPSFEQIFPGGNESHFALKVPSPLKAHLCGATRENHFDGVVSVVIRLLNLVQPNILILGEKDWQQLIILKKLLYDLNLNIKIESVPTVRDVDGIAFSSRNQYLNSYERSKVIALPKELKKSAQTFYTGKNLNLKTIKTSLEANDLKVEYLEIVNPENLQPLEKPSQLSLLAAAVHIGKTRLIDHTFLMKRFPIVAIDGPAGAGKSTVTKAFAKEMGLMYLDTGAMYRAVTWFIQEQNIDSKDAINIEESIKSLNLELQLTEDGSQKVFVNDRDVTNAIRSPIVTSNVSFIAAQAAVRELMTNQQRKIGLKGGLVAEGRDIGTKVFPQAELKIFLTASPEERAKRRSLDLKNRGFTVPSLIELEKQIKERDHLDSNRDISPLIKAKDATELITDGMSIKEVIELIIEKFRLKVPEEVWPTPRD